MALSEAVAAGLARSLYDLDCSAVRLASEVDLVYHLDCGNEGDRILKIAPLERAARLEVENRVVDAVATALPTYAFPTALPSKNGGRVVRLAPDLSVQSGPDGESSHLVRLLSYVPGISMARSAQSGPLLGELGSLLARMDTAMVGAAQPGEIPEHDWDLRRARSVIARYAAAIRDPERQALLEEMANRADERVGALAPQLPTGLIHGDANDHNVFVRAAGSAAERGGGDALALSGIIDFGDMVYSWRIGEASVAAAYAMMHKASPLAAGARLLAGYARQADISAAEVSAFLPLVILRLCVSVSVSAHRHVHDPDNAYARISESGAWALLAQLRTLPFELAEAAVHAVLAGSGQNAAAAWRTVWLDPAGFLDNGGDRDPALDDGDSNTVTDSRLIEARSRSIGPSVRLSYRRPLHIVRGWRQYLYDAGGTRYLDCVNNVAHVGHAHPRVVAALARQAAKLNTNTRYLDEHRIEYAERILARMPDPLEVCYFVCSGSEANELALRLARSFTGARNVITIEGAYHGNSGALVDISPYKFNGPGGGGVSPHVWTVPMPDPYRGRYHAEGAETGGRYAEHVLEAARAASARDGLAAFFAEPLLGCGGQVEPPAGFLPSAFEHVRAHGGVCVADEVQIGFGRLGDAFWGFDLAGAVPDIVTLGKPMGNGHPIGAVVTTRAIADAFDNGMEYFNSFGGNTVSCAVGLAVLDVIREEGLQEHARTVGSALKTGLLGLQADFPLIGDVRGRGLFLGVELVLDPATREPAPQQARALVEALRERGVLLSTDGPAHNVIKIKPPMPFDREDARVLVEQMAVVLATL